MKVINLTHGAGNGINKACLMTASNMLIGKGEEGDKNSCVCEILRNFILPTNDSMPQDLLGKIYGPLVWEILGTKNEDLDILCKRGYCFADWAVREILPISLRTFYLIKEAEDLENLREIINIETANAAYDMVTTIACGLDNMKHYIVVFNVASAAARATVNASDAEDYAAMHSVDITRRMTNHVANYAANAAGITARVAIGVIYEEIWNKCAEIIRKVASIGDKRPIETVCQIEDLCKMLI